MCVIVTSTNHICVQTQTQLIEDFSEELAASHRTAEAARENLMKEATGALETKAAQRAQQKATISKLSQVILSHAHTTVTFWRQTLQVLMAVHLSATPYMMDSTHGVDIATLGGFTSAFSKKNDTLTCMNNGAVES